jgi:hypothetical protein
MGPPLQTAAGRTAGLGVHASLSLCGVFPVVRDFRRAITTARRRDPERPPFGLWGSRFEATLQRGELRSYLRGDGAAARQPPSPAPPEATAKPHHA